MLGQLLSGGIEGILKGAGSIIDKFHMSPEDKAKLQLALQEHEYKVLKTITDEAKMQIEVNKTEAQHKSIFVSGWRPFVGWACGVGFAYAVMGRDMFNWLLATIGVFYELPVMPVLPTPDTGSIVNLLMGMLGMAGLRTYEKYKRVATK